MRAVDLIVRTHDRPWLTLLDRDLEREQVRHPRGIAIDDCIVPVAARLKVVHRIMFRRGNHVVRLDARNLRADHRSGEQRIFAAIFKIATVARIALQIDSAREHHVEPR